MKMSLNASDANGASTQNTSAVNAHVWLAQRMRRLSDSDLTEAMKAANLTTSDWAAMVQDCEGCACAKSCESFLSLFPMDADQLVGDVKNNDGRFRLLQSTLEEMGHG